MCRRHTGRTPGAHRAEAPAIESTVRRSRTAAEPPSRSRLLGPERAREHETDSERIQLPETGPEGRIYRQLGEVGHQRHPKPPRTGGDVLRSTLVDVSPKPLEPGRSQLVRD